jgi:AraC-like DNA-binding protein
MSQIWQTQNGSEQAKAWRMPVLGNLEVLHATYITHTFPRHAHAEFCIGTVIRGAEQVRYRGTTYVAPAGSVVVLQPGEVHSNWAANDIGWSYKVFYPDAQLMQQVAVSAGVPAMPFFQNPVLHDRSLFQLLVRLHALLEHPQTTSRLEQESHLLLTLKHLVTRYASSPQLEQPTPQENRAVSLIKDYLETHYADNPSLENLSHFSGISPYHLTRIFRDAIGLPPHAYLTQVRIHHAKSLLLDGWAIAQVAAETGFTDQSHFTKSFKTLVGVTPGRYQKQKEG